MIQQAGLYCPTGHLVHEQRHRLLVGPVTRTDDDGRTRTERRVVGQRAWCDRCATEETVMIEGPFVGRRVEVARG